MRSTSAAALRIAVIYAMLSCTWILISDRALKFLLGADIEQFAFFATLKGWCYVLVVSVLLYILVVRALDAFHRMQRQAEEAREEAQAASNAKDQFLAVLSHELRTPLTPVLAAIAAMDKADHIPPSLHADIRMVRRNVELEVRLIDDLLDLTRITTGNLRIQPQYTDAHALLASALEICRPDIHSKKLQVNLQFNAPAPYLQADPSRLLQVFWNLIRNAIKFTPNGGTITIQTRNELPPADAAAPVQGPSLIIDISDTGVGIDPQILPRLFEPFHPGSVLAQNAGLGLGLAISKAVISLHHGILSASSAGPNRGATFTVELPLAADKQPKPQSQPLPSPADSSAPPTPLRILLVEDNLDTARILSRLLKTTGYHVSVAETVQSATTLAQEHSFDLIVSDIGLPDGNGHDLMRRIQTIHPTPGIAISGFGMQDDIQRSLAAGFSEHLVKPVTFEMLEQSISRTTTKANPNN